LDTAFNTYELKQAPLIFDSENQKWIVSYIIEAEKERVLEAIDTTYHLTSDAISISDMEESRSRIMVWNKRTKHYNDLVFD